jgi:hypothetical protein
MRVKTSCPLGSKNMSRGKRSKTGIEIGSNARNAAKRLMRRRGSISRVCAAAVTT